MSPAAHPADLARDNAELRAQLDEAQELIEAIRTGSVDALAVQSAEGPRIFTLQSADQGYRTLIEQMNEGALLLSDDATVLYSNASLATLLGCPLEEVIGRRSRVCAAGFRAYWAGLWRRAGRAAGKGELPLHTAKRRAAALFAVHERAGLHDDRPRWP